MKPRSSRGRDCEVKQRRADGSVAALAGNREDDPMGADSELLSLWTRGWALTRGVAPPLWDDGGWRIEVGADDQLQIGRAHV